MKLDLRRFGECKTSELQKAELIRATANSVKNAKVIRNRILVATYVQRTITKGGIHLADKTMDESRYQGKVGLILKMGPKAFHFPEHDAQIAVGDLSFMLGYPGVGDWVMYRAADTWEVGLGGASCRFVYDEAVWADIEEPEAVW